MIDFNDFEKLAKKARRETSPRVDVAESVLAAIRVEPAPITSGFDRTMVAIASFAALAATVVAVVTWQLMEEPLVAEVLSPLVGPVMASQ